MADDDVQYELKTVQAIRGTEARATAKWQKEGWEFVSQDKGTLRTAITFRRPQRKLPWRLIAVAGGGVAALIAVAAAVGLFDEEPGNTDPAVPPVTAESSSGAPVTPPSANTTPTAETAESETAESESAETTEASTPAESVLTVDNNEDLAALLRITDYCDSPIGDFAAKYKGQTISFDAGIGAMGAHGDYDTRYDILLNAGEYSETSSIGPNFQFRDVNTVGDLHFTDTDYPDTIGVGDNLRITAEVDKYEKASCLFLLKPVSTEFR